MGACLTSADFAALNRGLISKQETAKLRAHIDACDACRVAHEEHLRDQSFLDNAKSLMATEADSDAPATFIDTSPTGIAAKVYPHIDGYDIKSVIGQGGMGIVYKAVQTKLNRTVAIKVLPAIIGTASPSAVARFRREATSAGRLHHTNIIPIYDFGESRDAYYYAMELIVGQPLNVLIKRFAGQDTASASPTQFAELLRIQLTSDNDGQRIESPDGSGDDDSSPSSTIGSSTTGRGKAYFRQVARWTADVADALHYAHGQGIIHRDIKPANLILSTDGRIMVADFGLARSVDEQSVTLTGSLLGTLRYVSPEQAMAKRVRLDHRTDIYSLGVTMYELLCFQPAFPGTDDKEVLGAIISREPAGLRKLVHAIPPELETICLKAIEKSADARYATSRALAEDLRRFIHDIPIEARRPGPVRRVVKFVRRRKALVSSIVAVVLLVLVPPALFHFHKASLKSEADGYVDSGIRKIMQSYWSEGEAEFRRALDIDENHVDALLAITWKNLEYLRKVPGAPETELLQDSLADCRKILSIEPDNYRALNYLGIILKRLRNYDEAIKTYQRLIDLEEDYFPAWSNRGAIHALKKEIPQAEVYLQTGATLCDKSALHENRDVRMRAEDRAVPWRSLAALQLHLGQRKALESIDRAIQWNSTDYPSLVLQARAQLVFDDDTEVQLDSAKFADRTASNQLSADKKRKNEPKAKQFADRTASDQPSAAQERKRKRKHNPKAKRMLALAHLRHGNYEHAVKHATLAIRAGDLETFDRLVIAIAEARMKHFTRAKEELDLAIRHWPDKLREQTAFYATHTNGVLWFEEAAELHALRAEAKTLLNPPPNTP